MSSQVQIPRRFVMTVFNLGSINIDLFYTVPHFPAPGETLASLDHRRALGGKGANQSIALARAGAPVVHIGATSPEDGWIRSEMREAGVDIGDIQDSDDATGHAVVTVSVDGENQILLCPSANATIDMGRAVAVLNAAQPETGHFCRTKRTAPKPLSRRRAARGLKLAYSAAPFDAAVTAGLLPHTDLLIVNEGEAAALGEMLGRPPEESGVPHLVITRGGEGADYHGEAGHIHQPAFAVTPVDTTGAGDCFFGYFLAGTARGDAIDRTLRLAAAAAALQVTQHGAAAAIPPRDAVDAFLASQS